MSTKSPASTKRKRTRLESAEIIPLSKYREKTTPLPKQTEQAEPAYGINLYDVFLKPKDADKACELEAKIWDLLKQEDPFIKVAIMALDSVKMLALEHVARNYYRDHPPASA